MGTDTALFSTPFGAQGRSLVVDLSVNMASARQLRNLLKIRNVVNSSLSSMRNESVTLPQVASGQAPSQLEITPSTQTSALVLSSDSPVRLILVTSNGSLNLGEQTLFVFTSGIVSLTLINDQNLNACNVNLILI